MNRQIRICHVVGGIVGGGVEQVVINYCSKMPDMRFDLLYQYEPNQTCLSRLNKAGVNCIQIPAKMKYPFKHLYSLYSFFKNGEYDAIHCHLDWYLNWIVCLCALVAGVKKRIAHHHHAYDEKTFFHKLIYSVLQGLNRFFATHYLACSPQAAINGWGVNAVKSGWVLVLNNAINIDHFKFDEKKRLALRSKLNIHDEICIGHVGRFCYQKNQEFLLNVFNRIHERNDKTILLMIGDGPEKKQIMERVCSLNLLDSVRVVETQENVAPYYSAMDVFCLPSRWEGLGMVLIEAQVNGLPCLASMGVPQSAKISEDFVFIEEKVDLWVESLIERKTYSHDNKAYCDQFDIDKQFESLRRIYLD